MKNQTAFNKVWKHFVVELNPPSINKHNSCLYRGPRGAKCAFGIFIPDHLYKREFENTTADNLLKQFPDLAKHIHVDPGFAYQLQACHDQSTHTKSDFHTQIKRKLEILAADENLTLPKKGR
jgi:hypothetical protein